MTPAESTADTIVQEISINAPAARVFDAFATPAERVKWWRVEGRFETTHMESDLRPGGRWSMGGRRSDGQPFTVKGEYRVVDRPSALVFTWCPDWQGNTTESLVRLDFAEVNGVTRVRLTHSGLVTEPLRAGHRGWPQLLGCLQEHVERQAH